MPSLEYNRVMFVAVCRHLWHHSQNKWNPATLELESSVALQWSCGSVEPVSHGSSGWASSPWTHSIVAVIFKLGDYGLSLSYSTCPRSCCCADDLCCPFYTQGSSTSVRHLPWPHQKLILTSNNRVVRTALLISLTGCYLLWMVTYLAQLHPLIGNNCFPAIWIMPQFTFTLAPIRTVKAAAWWIRWWIRRLCCWEWVEHLYQVCMQ